VVSVEHIGEEDLEQYAMRTIPESACAALVWHLLVCQSCRDRLEATEGYLAAMRSAAAIKAAAMKAAAKIRRGGHGR
jgi:hypothetical protein